MNKKLFSLASIFMALLILVGVSSCKDDKDDAPAVPTLVGTWVNIDEDDDESTVTTILFNADYTGTITEAWNSRSTHNYAMSFEWSIRQTADGRTVLTVSKKGRADEMDLFPGSSGGIVVWTREFYLTGNTLSIATGDDYVMVFNRIG